MKRIFARMAYWMTRRINPQKLKEGLRTANRVKKILEINGFRVKHRGLGSSTDRVFSPSEYEKLKAEKPALPDLEVIQDNRTLAWIEVQGSENYTYMNSKHFSVGKYKADNVKVEEPYFIVFVLWLENGFYWRRVEGIEKCPMSTEDGPYEVPPESWNIGEKCFIDVLRLISKRAKQLSAL